MSDHPIEAVVVGGTGGIGSAIVTALTGAGFHVGIAARDGERCRRQADALRANGLGATALPVDVTSESSVRALAQTLACHDRLRIVVFAVGAASKGGLDAASSGQLQMLLETHVIGVYRVLHALAPQLKPRSAQVIAVLSKVTRKPTAQFHQYGAAKMALQYLLLALAEATAEHGLRINCVSPPATETSMFRRLVADIPGAVSQVSPSDVADAVMALIQGDETGTITYLSA